MRKFSNSLFKRLTMIICIVALIVASAFTAYALIGGGSGGSGSGGGSGVGAAKGTPCVNDSADAGYRIYIANAHMCTLSNNSWQNVQAYINDGTKFAVYEMFAPGSGTSYLTQHNSRPIYSLSQASGGSYWAQPIIDLGGYNNGNDPSFSELFAGIGDFGSIPTFNYQSAYDLSGLTNWANNTLKSDALADNLDTFCNNYRQVLANAGVDLSGYTDPNSIGYVIAHMDASTFTEDGYCIIVEPVELVSFAGGGASVVVGWQDSDIFSAFAQSRTNCSSYIKWLRNNYWNAMTTVYTSFTTDDGVGIDGSANPGFLAYFGLGDSGEDDHAGANVVISYSGDVKAGLNSGASVNYGTVVTDTTENGQNNVGIATPYSINALASLNSVGSLTGVQLQSWGTSVRSPFNSSVTSSYEDVYQRFGSMSSSGSVSNMMMTDYAVYQLTIPAGIKTSVSSLYPNLSGLGVRAYTTSNAVSGSTVNAGSTYNVKFTTDSGTVVNNYIGAGIYNWCSLIAQGSSSYNSYSTADMLANLGGYAVESNTISGVKDKDATIKTKNASTFGVSVSYISKKTYISSYITSANIKGNSAKADKGYVQYDLGSLGGVTNTTYLAQQGGSFSVDKSNSKIGSTNTYGTTYAVIYKTSDVPSNYKLQNNTDGSKVISDIMTKLNTASTTDSYNVSQYLYGDVGVSRLKAAVSKALGTSDVVVTKLGSGTSASGTIGVGATGVSASDGTLTGYDVLVLSFDQFDLPVVSNASVEAYELNYLYPNLLGDVDGNFKSTFKLVARNSDLTVTKSGLTNNSTATFYAPVSKYTGRFPKVGRNVPQFMSKAYLNNSFIPEFTDWYSPYIGYSSNVNAYYLGSYPTITLIGSNAPTADVSNGFTGDMIIANHKFTNYYNIFDYRLNGNYFGVEAGTNVYNFTSNELNSIRVSHAFSLGRGLFGDTMTVSSFNPTTSAYEGNSNFLTKNLYLKIGNTTAITDVASKLSENNTSTLDKTLFDSFKWTGSSDLSFYVTSGIPQNTAWYRLQELCKRYIATTRDIGVNDNAGTFTSLDIAKPDSLTYKSASIATSDANCSFFTEVPMRAYKSLQRNVLSQASDVAPITVYTLGERVRSITPSSMYMISVNGDANSVSGQTISNSVATGTDAKNLSKNMNNLQVIYAGGDVSLKASSNASIRLTGYSIDLINKDDDGHINSDNSKYTSVIADNSALRSIWSGWNSYDPYTEWDNWVTSVRDNIGVDVSLETTSTKGTVVKDYNNFSVSLGQLSGGASTPSTKCYAIEIKNGTIDKTTQGYADLINSIAINYLSLADDATVTASQYAQAEAVFEASGLYQSVVKSIETSEDADNNSEVSSIFGGTKWYDETVRTIVIREFTTDADLTLPNIALSDKIDITSGPTDTGKTSASSFNTGYYAKWYLTVFFKNNITSLSDATLYDPAKAGTLDKAVNYGSVVMNKVHISGADFIIPDTTTASTSNY